MCRVTLHDAEGCAKKLKELAGDGIEVKEVSCIGRCDHAAGRDAEPRTDPARGHRSGEGVGREARNGTALRPAAAIAMEDRPVPDSRVALWRISQAWACAGRRGELALAELKASGCPRHGRGRVPAGAEVGAGAQETAIAEVRHLQRRRERAGHVQGREDPRRRAAPGHRRHDARRRCTVGAETRHRLPPPRVRGRAAGGFRPRSTSHANGCAARTSSAPGDFDIEIFVSPGGYILGEETALLEAPGRQARRAAEQAAVPRHARPVRPADAHQQRRDVRPRAGDPVERRREWWKAQGKHGCAGLKFIAVSGHVEKPGVYEVPLGTTVRELIDRAGGVKDGKKLLAFAPGGASSNFLPADKADVPLDFAELAKAGSMLGSGALVVVAEGTDLLALAANVTRFFRNESCGKCVPCRVGSEKAVELLDAVLDGASPANRARRAARPGRDDGTHLDLRAGASRGGTGVVGVEVVGASHMNLTIDGKPSPCPPGSTIYDAAKRAGIDIPVLCHHPKLQPVGVCRMCVVDVGGRVLAASCVRPCEEGMKVETASPKVEKQRQDADGAATGGSPRSLREGDDHWGRCT